MCFNSHHLHRWTEPLRAMPEGHSAVRTPKILVNMPMCKSKLAILSVGQVGSFTDKLLSRRDNWNADHVGQSDRNNGLVSQMTCVGTYLLTVTSASGN